MDRLLTDTGHREVYGTSREDYVMYLVGAYAHDVGHRGLGNHYYLSTHHELALLYLYDAPLEHMHTSTLLRILHRHGLHPRPQLREKLVAMILATAPEHHERTLAQLQALPEHRPAPEPLLLGLLLHAADISNPSKHYPLFLEWGLRIQAEFHNQKQLL